MNELILDESGPKYSDPCICLYVRVSLNFIYKVSLLLCSEVLCEWVLLLHAIPSLLPILESKAWITLMSTHQVVTVSDCVKDWKTSSLPYRIWEDWALRTLNYEASGFWVLFLCLESSFDDSWLKFRDIYLNAVVDFFESWNVFHAYILIAVFLQVNTTLMFD